MISKSDIEALASVTHLVLLIEENPLSDKYVQIMLPPEVFKQMSDLVWNSMPDAAKKGEKTITIRPMEPVKIPDLDSSYPKEFIRKVQRHS